MKSFLTSYASLVTPKLERAQKPMKQQHQYYSTYSAKVENMVFLYKSWTRNWARTDSLPVDVSTKLSTFFMPFYVF